MQARMSQLIAQVSQFSESTLGKAQNVSDSASTSQLSVQRQAGELELIATSMSQLVSNVQEVSQNSHVTAEKANSAGDKCREGRVQVDHAVSRINQVIRAATLDRKKSDDRIELSDGRTLDFAGVPLPDGNGLLTVLDVTASRQAEEALRERNRALEEADAVMTRFLANMSYEFRTPLTSIGGFAELLTSGIAGELTPQAKEYAQAISLSVGKLTEQVENVLDLSQSEAGLMPLRKTELELLPFITQIVRKQEGRILDGELTLDLKGNPDKSVTADPQQLRRAISQLLDNAIKGTPRGGRIVVDIGRKRGETKIIISDNGRGMSQHELARALEGIRMAPGGKGIERRQGLGIPLARQLIEAHDGTLDIQSRKNGGTTATITLP